MSATKARLSEAAPVTAVPRATASEPEFSGQRRLIRPSLSARSRAQASTLSGPSSTDAHPAAATYGHGPTLTSRAVQNGGKHEESSHAEVFYFQKQIQAQTRMVVVLENSEQIEGVIEWYDRYAIKMRNLSPANGQNRALAARTRMLIYKSSIRYIYKAGENTPQTMT